jgi:hypothetical protein
MKTKIILMAALLGVAAMSANAGVRFGIQVGFPLPVIVSTPAVCAPAPVTVVQTVPACPDVNYVWSPGYWSYRPTGRVWMSGGWHYRPTHIDRDRDRDRGHDHDRGGYRR